MVEEYQAWKYFADTDYRWAFNKLEVALRGGLHAGPAAVAPDYPGLYVSRPIYNLYGMGVGAKQFSYATREEEEFIHHKEVPPGFFWTEWLQGPQVSIDYRQYESGKWKVESVWEGSHYSDSNLTKFKCWTRLSTRKAPSVHELPIDLNWLEDTRVPYFNVEMREKKIIEIHFRPGDDRFNHLPVGTTVYPVWKGEELDVLGEWQPNFDPKWAEHEAHGQLSEVRDGFIIVRNPHQ